MLSNRFYYTLKPYLPWSLRMGVRRVLARRQRAAHAAVWPINEAAAAAPAGWTGWPEGRKFAFVLTHDVEGPEGLAKVRQLAELEMELGFRSSFNFIPEGPYAVPAELRAWLLANGFEVGVHDLAHDGKLFNSRREFSAKAGRINHYLRDWGAAGYRSGFMLRNLDWLHELQIEYDASTFDTDPFEPQSDGVGTIFPFWIPAPAASALTPSSPSLPQSPPPSLPSKEGYIELPYTLPQDSTLFLLLQEKNPEIWLRKLDWVAAHGGMALVNVHPDYVRLDGEAAGDRTYPVAFYRTLLEHLRERYAGTHWQALPGQVARHALKMTAGGLSPCPPPGPFLSQKTSFPPRPNPMKSTLGRIVMLVENNFPQDTRVRNEAMLLTSAGYKVSVICLKAAGQASFSIVDGVRVYRFPRLELFEKTIAKPGRFGQLLLKVKALLGYGIEYFYFTSACFLTSCYILVRHGFDAIHAHNPPDTLFLVAAPFRLIGKKFVFDHHDLCPELYMSRFRTGECFPTRILRVTEWCSLKLAQVTIATNESYRNVQIERAGRDPATIFVVRNGPGAKRMQMVPPAPRLRALNKCILVYIGSLNPQDGVDYLLRSLHHLQKDLGRRDFHCVIMGSGDSLGDLRAQATELQLDGCVELTGYISNEDLQANLAAADICVDPDPSSPLNDVSTWIKIMEYMAYAKPIVTYDLKETRYSAQEAAVYVPPNDEMEFARAIAGLLDAPDRRKAMGDFGRKRVETDLQWAVVGQNLLAAYRYLLGPLAGTAASSGQKPAKTMDSQAS